MNSKPKAPSPSKIEVFVGQANPAVAQIYVRWHGPRAASGKLTGTWRGPTCRHARCLPFTAPLIDQGPGMAPLAKVTVPDPSAWTPDFPALYKIDVQLRDESGQMIDAASQWFGLRSIIRRGRNLVSEGDRIVLRGRELRAGTDNDKQLGTARALRMAIVATNPSEDFCEAASREGVVLIVRLEGPTDQIVERLFQLSCWPAVTVALLRHPLPQVPFVKLSPQILIGQEILRPGDEPVADWADLVVCHLSNVTDEEIADEEITAMRSLTIPCLAMWASAGEGDSSDVQSSDVQSSDVQSSDRRECERRQQSLAGRIELAGYLVGR